jgi:hypothetical protein
MYGNKIAEGNYQKLCSKIRFSIKISVSKTAAAAFKVEKVRCKTVLYNKP